MEGWAKPPGCLAVADGRRSSGGSVEVIRDAPPGHDRHLRPRRDLRPSRPRGDLGPRNRGLPARRRRAGRADDALPPGAVAQRSRRLGGDGRPDGGAAGRGGGRAEGALRRRPPPAAAIRGAGPPRRGHHDPRRRAARSSIASWPRSPATPARSARTGPRPRGRCSRRGSAGRRSSASTRRRCRVSGRRPSAAWYNAGDVTLHPRRRGRRGPPSQRRDRPGGRRATPAAEAAADAAAVVATEPVARSPPPRPAAGLEEPPEARSGRHPGRRLGRCSRRRPVRRPDGASGPRVRSVVGHDRPGDRAPAGAAAPRRRGRPPGRTARPTTPAVARRDRLSIEQIVAVESPREPRLSPDGRRVAYTAEAAGARQVFVLDLRSRAGPPGHRLRARRHRSPVVARRRVAGLRPREGHLDRRHRRVAPDPRRRPPGRPALAALGARRPPPRLHLAAPRLEPGLGRRCAAAPARPAAGARGAPPAAGAHADRRRRRGPPVVPGRIPPRGPRPARPRPLRRCR